MILDNVDYSKLWFEQNYIDPNEPDAGFGVTFDVPSTQQGSQYRSNTSDEPDPNSLPLSLDSQGDIAPIPVPASKGDVQPHPVSPAHKEDTTSINSEREQGTRSRKIKVRFKDTESSMLSIIDLQQTGLHRSSRLAKRESVHENGDLVYNLFINYSSATSKSEWKPRLIAKRILYAKEMTSTLIDNTINHVSEFILVVIDNEIYAFKTMLQQLDRSQFITAMEQEVSVHQRRNHQEVCLYSEIPKGMKTILSIWSFKRKRLPLGELLKYKARLYAHESEQQWRINYWKLMLQ